MSFLENKIDELKEIISEGNTVSLEDFRCLSEEEQYELINYCSELEGFKLNQKSLITKYFETATVLRDIDREFAIWNATANKLNKLEDLVANRRKKLGLPELIEYNDEFILEKKVDIKEEKHNALFYLELSECDANILSTMINQFKELSESDNLKIYSLLDKYDNELQGNKKNTSFNIYTHILNDFEELCNSKRAYKHDIISVALIEFINKFKK